MSKDKFGRQQPPSLPEEAVKPGPEHDTFWPKADEIEEFKLFSAVGKEEAEKVRARLLAPARLLRGSSPDSLQASRGRSHVDLIANSDLRRKQKSQHGRGPSGVADKQVRMGAATADNSPRAWSHPPRRIEGYVVAGAASSKSSSSPGEGRAQLVRSEDISIDGCLCHFEYLQRPFQIYLRGDVPPGVSKFEVGGRSWNLDRLEPGLYAVPGLELRDIDRFRGVAHWVN